MMSELIAVSVDSLRIQHAEICSYFFCTSPFQKCFVPRKYGTRYVVEFFLPFLKVNLS
jgi:hypothetical protein